MGKLLKIEGVTGRDDRLSFIACTPSSPKLYELEDVAQWLRENVYFVISPAKQGKDEKDHLSILDSIRNQLEPTAYVVSAGYVFDKDYNDYQVGKLRYSDGDSKKMVFGSDSLKTSGILSGFDVAYELNYMHNKVKSILRKIYAEF